MASSMFKNFDYSLINSTVSNHKEVLVTYLYKDKAARQYLFIKEVKGKGNDYYLSEAKNIINKMIKNGKLAKGSNKFVKGSKKAQRGGAKAKKPILVAASCVLAAGALGAGGYFLGSYLGGGNGGGANSFTVTLLPGDGYFPDGSKAHLTFTDVKKGTILNKLDGYMIPSNDYNLDFEAWTNTQGEQFTETTVVNSDLVLTASFVEGVNYYRELTINEIQDKIDDLKDAGADEQFTRQFEEILGTVEETFNNSDLIVNGEQAKALKEFADATLDQSITMDAEVKEVGNNFEAILSTIGQAESKHTLTLLNIAAKCEKSTSRHLSDKTSYDYFKNLFNKFAEYISSADETLTHILEIITPIVMDSTSKFVNVNLDQSRLMEFLDSGARAILEYENLTDDQIKELGAVIGNYIAALANSDVWDDINSFYGSVFDSFEAALDAEEDKELMLAIYKLRSEGMKVFTNLSNVEDQFREDTLTAASLIDYVIEQFKNLYYGEVINLDNIESATNFALLAVNAVKNINVNDSEGFKNAFNNLIGSYLSEGNLYKDVDYKTMESLAKLPIYMIQNNERNAGIPSLVDYLLGIRNQAIYDIQNAKGEIGKEIMKEIQLGIIESAAYSNFSDLVKYQDWMVNLKSAYDEAVTICNDGSATESDRYRASLLSGFFIGFSKELQYHLLFCSIQQTQGVFSNIPVGNIIDEVNYFSDEKKQIFSEYFISIMSNLPSRFRSFAAQGSYNEYIENEFRRFTPYFENLNELENFYKEVKKLYSCDYIFEYNDPTKALMLVIPQLESQRLKDINDNGRVFEILENAQYPTKARFDDIFETFEEELYSKICYNINYSILDNLLIRVERLVD